jgi:NADPH:quinone reductase-like Zn-dependent oxidoreductase
MKAVLFENNHLVYKDIPKPEPGPGEVLVRIKAASVNALDYRMMKMGIIPKNRIYGADIAGLIEAVGPGSCEWKAGDEVIGELSDSGLGGFAEYAAVPRGVLVRKPENLDWGEAAALPVAAVTAYMALVVKGSVKPGESVLVCGAGGGVGSYAVQLASHFGARVTALCGPSSLDHARSSGAGEVYDYNTTDFDALPGKYDLILLINGGYPLGECRRKLTDTGTCVIIGGPLKNLMAALLATPFLSLGRRKFRILNYKTDREMLNRVVTLAGQGAVRPRIGQTYPLEKTAEAVALLATGHNSGKIVIIP